jgi:hypothetical protein
MLHWMTCHSSGVVIIHAQLTPLVEPEPHQTVPIETVSSETVQAFRWNPMIYMDAIRRETIRGKGGSLLGPCGRASCKMADSFFTHITNFVAQRHSVITSRHQFLEPRAYLNVEITNKQCYLLQPTAADVFIGNIPEDSLVQNAKKKIPSRHINFYQETLQATVGCTTIPKRFSTLRP